MEILPTMHFSSIGFYLEKVSFDERNGAVCVCIALYWADKPPGVGPFRARDLTNRTGFGDGSI